MAKKRAARLSIDTNLLSVETLQKIQPLLLTNYLNATEVKAKLEILNEMEYIKYLIKMRQEKE